MNWSRRIAGIFERQPQDLDVGHAIDAGLKRLRQEERLESGWATRWRRSPRAGTTSRAAQGRPRFLRKSILFSAPPTR